MNPSVYNYTDEAVVQQVIRCSKARSMRHLRLRDNLGAQQVIAMMMQSGKNLDWVTGGRDEFGRKTRLSSLGNALNVRVQGAFAMTLAVATKSLVPFMAISRGLDNAAMSIWYEKLVNKEGDEILGIGPTNIDKIHSTNEYTVTGNGTATPKLTVANVSGGDVRIPTPRSIEIAILSADGKRLGTIKGDATTQTSTLAGVVMTVIPNAGNTEYGLALEGAVPNGAVIKVIRALYGDRLVAESAGSTVRLERKAESVELVTAPRSISIEGNDVNRAYLRKIQETVGAGVSNPETTFESAKTLMIDLVNWDLLQLLRTSDIATTRGLDLSGYTMSDFSNTKEDMIGTWLTNQVARFRTKTRFSPTGIVCSPLVGSTLQNTKLFVADPTFTGGSGLIGTFGGLPVYVLTFLAGDFDNPGEEELYLVFKSPDEMFGTAAYGEWLPITSTGECRNWEVPTKVAEGFFSMYGTILIDDRLALKSSIRFPEFLFGDGETSVSA